MSVDGPILERDARYTRTRQGSRVAGGLSPHPPGQPEALSAAGSRSRCCSRQPSAWPHVK